MSDTEPIVVPLARKAGGDLSTSEGSRRANISFNRQELSQILNVYGRKVASGEWRDYAIDTLERKGRVFGVPKDIGMPALSHREGAEAGAAPGRL